MSGSDRLDCQLSARLLRATSSPRCKSQAIWWIKPGISRTALIYAFQFGTLTREPPVPPDLYTLLTLPTLYFTSRPISHPTLQPLAFRLPMFCVPLPRCLFFPQCPARAKENIFLKLPQTVSEWTLVRGEATREGPGRKHKHSLGRAWPGWLRNEGNVCPSQRLMGKYWPRSMAPLRFGRVSVRLSGIDAHQRQVCWRKLLRGAQVLHNNFVCFSG